MKNYFSRFKYILVPFLMILPSLLIASLSVLLFGFNDYGFMFYLVVEILTFPFQSKLAEDIYEHFMVKKGE